MSTFLHASPPPAPQIVVDNEVTAKELLEKGKLTKRVTIIPLNKVGGKVWEKVWEKGRG